MDQAAVCLRVRTVGDLAAVISPGLAKAALAGKVGDRLVDLSYPLTADASLQIITSKNPSDALPLYRHSTAHLLAAAVTNMFPGVQCGIGPPTDEGFFYDFVVPRPFVPEDLEAIENRRCARWRTRIWSSSARCGRATRPSNSFASAASRSRCS